MDTIAQFYLNLLNEKGSEEVRLKLEPQFKQVLNQVANQLSKDDYRQLKQYSRAKVDLAKSAISECRYDKSLRIGWKLNKQACVFAMRYFSRR